MDSSERELIDRYLDGKLSDAEASELERRLADDLELREELVEALTLRAMVELAVEPGQPVTETCRRARAQTEAYRRDRLPPERKASFAAHLEECGACRWFYDGYLTACARRATGRLRTPVAFLAGVVVVVTLGVLLEGDGAPADAGTSFAVDAALPGPLSWPPVPVADDEVAGIHRTLIVLEDGPAALEAAFGDGLERLDPVLALADPDVLSMLQRLRDDDEERWRLAILAICCVHDPRLPENRRGAALSALDDLDHDTAHLLAYRLAFRFRQPGALAAIYGVLLPGLRGSSDPGLVARLFDRATSCRAHDAMMSLLRWTPTFGTGGDWCFRVLEGEVGFNHEQRRMAAVKAWERGDSWSDGSRARLRRVARSGRDPWARLWASSVLMKEAGDPDARALLEELLTEDGAVADKAAELLGN